MSDGWIIASTAGAFAVVIAVITGLIMVGGYYAGRSECRAFAEQTGYQTKYEVLVRPLGVPVQWDCFALQQNGKWIPKNKLRDIE